MKQIIYSLLSIVLLFINSVVLYANNTADKFGIEKIDDGLKHGTNDLITIIDNSLGYVIGLFYFISIIIGIYGGFTILTSLGDEEKVKKGKNMIIYVIVGLIVIFLTSQIINWVIDIMNDTEIVG